MSYTYEKKDGKVVVKIKIAQKDFEDAVQQSYEQNASKYNVEGFRKGKAPRKMIEKQYGEGVFFDDALNIAFANEYYAFLDAEKGVDPIENPDVKIDKFDGEGIDITATVTVVPEITLGAYTGLKATEKKVEVTEEEINRELEQMRNRNARFVEVEDRACKMGDAVHIDFTGYVDGKEFEGGKADNYHLELGTHTFIPGFEEGVVGMTKGEEKDIEVTFPEDYHAEQLKGKKAIFKVKVLEIEGKIVPELDDEFASNVSEFETLAEYKENIKNHLLTHKQEHAIQQVENDMLDAIVESSKVEVPDILVEREKDSMIKDFETRLAYQGLKLEDYAKYSNTTVEEIRNSQTENAKHSVKSRLVMKEIIKKENLYTTEAELNAKIEEISKPYKKTAEEYKKQLSDRDLLYFENKIMVDKFFTFLRTNNTIVKE